VQRHLQLRIEAQGKYLQAVLEQAQETLGKQNLGPANLEDAKIKISQLVSQVSTEQQAPAEQSAGTVAAHQSLPQIHGCQALNTRRQTQILPTCNSQSTSRNNGNKKANMTSQLTKIVVCNCDTALQKN